MIQGYNSSSNIYISESEFEQYATGLSDLATTGKVLDNLKRRRENVLAGGVNCIPLPFPRFRSEIPGVEQGQYVIVTANEKTGKTSLADFVYVFHVLDYCFNNRDKCSCHIIYFSLEESVQKVIERYMSHLLYKLDNIRIAPTDLRSTSIDYPVPQEVLDKFESEPYKERLKFFEECVQFETEDTNPTGILRVCQDYAKSVGQYNTHTQMSKGESFKEINVFDSYIQNDPNHYKICIIDHIGLVDKEQGFSTKGAIDKMSEYCVKYLRNRLNYTVVGIQQQAAEAQGLEAVKQKRMLPSTATLGDSKYTSRDADLVIGMFDPSRFGLSTWLEYKIEDADRIGLRNYARFMYVLANRNGEMGGICPLFFDGTVCHFEELPRPTEISELTSFYARAQNLKSFRQTKKKASLMLLLFIKLLKRNRK